MLLQLALFTDSADNTPVHNTEHDIVLRNLPWETNEHVNERFDRRQLHNTTTDPIKYSNKFNVIAKTKK